jgi:Heparinase II/III-like protein
VIRRLVKAVLLALLALMSMQDHRSAAQAHERPYFMPPVERDRLHGLISKEAWAKADHARLTRAASTGDGFAAAFLYALDGDPRDAAIAQQWLLGKYGKKAYWTVQAANRLNGDFFKGGQVGIPEVYYDTDLSGYLAFDWAHNGLQATARKEIEEGIVLWSRYKMRAMRTTDDIAAVTLARPPRRQGLVQRSRCQWRFGAGLDGLLHRQAGQIRVANYGDGSTNAMGDLILVNPAAESGNIVMHEPLIAAYNASRDPRYGAFVSMIPGYTPNLIDRPPLPANIHMPPAPSKVWPTYGLAMLRSDESPNYWTSGKAIAVFQIMSKGYGHDHRDKFSISLHGAGRLFYPNYNTLQYENPSVGWTRNSVSHNTLVVDEGETRNAELTALRHEFSPDVKVLVSSADGVFEGIDQTRALLLTKEYLLDVVQATSAVPHIYDYVLHSFGRAEPEKSDAFEPTQALMKRYWLLDNQKSMTTDEPWMLDFVIEEKPGARNGHYGREWYEHKAKLRLRMAGEPQTLVVHGVWGNELARLVSEQHKGAKLDQLATVITRRTGREALFVTSHEPYSGTDQPQVTRIVTLARTKGAVIIRVDANEFADYAAIAFGPQSEGAEHTLLVPGERRYFFAFKNYGYARIRKDGSSVTLRGAGPD